MYVCTMCVYDVYVCTMCVYMYTMCVYDVYVCVAISEWKYSYFALLQTYYLARSVNANTLHLFLFTQTWYVLK